MEQGHLVPTNEEQVVNAALPVESRVKSDARVIMYPGKGHDAWWDGQQLLSQVSTLLSYVKVALTCMHSYSLMMQSRSLNSSFQAVLVCGF